MATCRLKSNLTPGARLAPIEAQGGWRLEIPAGPEGEYRLAQVDDYGDRPRRAFPWQPPFQLELQARASQTQVSGTWGFGLWNDPFGMAILSGVQRLRLPALPNTAWFFFASPPNYLSLSDDLPAQGWLAATFSSPRLPPPLLGLAAPVLPALAFRPSARLLRRVGSVIVRHEAAGLDVDPTGWHRYRLDWNAGSMAYRVDERIILAGPVAPRGSLGLVIWIDNQYAAWQPDGRLRFGTLSTEEPAWIEIRALKINGEEAQIEHKG